MASFLHNGIQDPGPFHLVAPPFPVAGGKGGDTPTSAEPYPERAHITSAHPPFASSVTSPHRAIKEAEKQCIPVSSKRGCEFLADTLLGPQRLSHNRSSMNVSWMKGLKVTVA